MARVDLSVDFLGVRLKNPIVAASGSITYSFENLRSCIEAGVGAITLKSIVFNRERCFRDARPRYYFLDKYGRPNMFTQAGGKGFISRKVGLKTLNKIKPIAKDENVVVIANIGTERPLDTDAISDTAKQLENAGANMLEISLACPFTINPIEQAVLDREAAALVPASVCPPLCTITGFNFAAIFRTSKNRLPSLTPSMYRAIISVSVS